MKLICPKCGTKDPVILIQPRQYYIREYKDKWVKAAWPRALRCIPCGQVSPQWHFNAKKLKGWRDAKRGRPKKKPEAVNGP